MSAWAKPGVKCVCVDNWHVGIGASPLVVGGVYTIADTAPLPPGRELSGSYANTSVAVHLKEVTNPFGYFFAIERFRPLAYKPQSLEHDTALFLGIAGHVPAPEKEAAE